MSKTVSGTTTHFHYDEAGHLIAESNGSTGAMVREYVWLDDMPLAQIESGGTVYYVHPDQLNTPQKITDTSKSIVWDRIPEPFGDTFSTPTNTTPTNLRFPGQYADAESGLSYNYFRDYDSTLGKYIEADPIGLDGTSYASMGLYDYAAQNAIRYVDPTGQDWFNFCPKPDNEDKCKELNQQINNDINELQKRYNELQVDTQDLYHTAYSTPVPGKRGTYTGHQESYKQAQNRLNNNVRKAQSRGCKVPPEANQWLNQSPPQRPIGS